MGPKGEPDTKMNWSTDRRPQDEPQLLLLLNREFSRGVFMARSWQMRSELEWSKVKWSVGVFLIESDLVKCFVQVFCEVLCASVLLKSFVRVI
jgi:hypothetical protein